MNDIGPDIDGFIPDAKPPKRFQGSPIDPETGLVGFTPDGPLVPDSYEDQLSAIPEDQRLGMEQDKVEADALSDEFVAAKPGVMRKIWDAASTPLLNPSKALSVGKQLDFVTGKPYVPSEDDWGYWVTGKLDDLNLKMFPNGRQQGVEWMTQQTAPIELLKTLRVEFDTKFKDVPQGGRPIEDQNQFLNVAAGVVKGVETVAGGTMDFLTSPVGAATLGLGAAPAAIKKLVGAGFVAHMASQYPDLYRRAEEAAKSDDNTALAQVGTEAALNTLFMGLIGSGVAGLRRKNTETGVVPAAGAGPKYRFEQRAGETDAQFKLRFNDFAEEVTAFRLANTEPKLISDGPGPITPQSPLQRMAEGLQARRARLNGRKVIVPEAPLEAMARKLQAQREQAGRAVRLANLQDNPILIEGADIVTDFYGERKQGGAGFLPDGTVKPVKLDVKFEEDLKGEWPPQRPPARPDEGVVDPNAPQPDLKGEWPPSKDPLSKALEDALRRVLKVPAPAPSTKPADIRRQLEYRSRSMEGPAEAPVDASQSPTIQSPSEPIKVDPGASSSVPAPQKVVKPWEIRQQLQERSRSAVEPIEKNTPQGGELIPSMPGVRNFVEVPDNHPVVQFWRTPEAEKYAGIKAREAFPNDPATAADVANEAYAHLYLKASEFPAGRVKAQPWALRTISNYIKDKVIKVQREGKLKADNSEESVTTAVDSARDPLPLPDQAVVVREIEGALSKVAETFNDADREIYSVMTKESALDFKALAAKQGTSPATISRRVREIRGSIINALKKDGVDVGDYMEVMEAMNAAEEAGPSESSPPKPKGRGIGGSVRDGGKFKGGKSNGEAGFSRILPALSRIIHGWMRSGVSAARAVGHAVKMFGKGIAKWASLVTNRASYKTSSALQGFARPSRPATPVNIWNRTKLNQAARRDAGLLRRPGNWSALDKLRISGETHLREQSLQHEDRRAEWIGRWTTPLADIQNRYSAKEYKQGALERARYFELKESRDGGKTKAQADADALAYSIRMSNAGMELVEHVEKVSEETNKISRDLGVMVKAGNTWRAGNFNDDNYPRLLTEEFKRNTRDPHKNAESKAYVRKLQRDMVLNGNAKTMEAAEYMLTKDQWWDDSSGGYLANSEKARGMKLPDRVYDYSIDSYIGYVDQVADRLSQIEAFGQDLGGTQDTLFEVAASRTTDPRLINALGEMREHYLGKNESGNGMELARKANVITTVAYLGLSPMTAVRNVWGAQANAMYKYGVTPVIVASAKVAQHNLVAAAKAMVNVIGGNAKSVRSIDALVAQEIGAVQRDMRYAMVNSHVTNKPIINVKGLRGVTEENSVRFMMSMNALAERVGREITNAAAETWMRHTASFIQWDPNHPISRSRTADLRRLNFTTPEIAQLVAGDPVLMDRFRRAAVQKTNFGYSASESSTLFDKGWMKVFGQFQRYGAQAARFVDNDIVKPMFQKEGGKWTPNFLPFIKLMILAPVLGELYQELREGVFNKPRKTASIEEIGNTLTDDVKQGLTLMAQRYSTDVIYGSGVGIISDWFGMLKEFGERGRFKNPLEPPAFTLVEQFGQLLQHRRQRGLTFEGLSSDLSDFFKRFPAISQATGVADRVVKGNDSKAGKLSEANFVKQEARALTERFARERGGEINTKFNSSMRNVDENTAELDSLKDAMLSGDSKEARKIAISFIESAKDTAKARRTVQSVVRMSHPLYNQTAGINTLADVEDFLKWLGKRAPSKVADFRKVALRYESSSP